MRGLLLTVEQLSCLNAEDVVSQLQALYPDSEAAQIRSWQVLAQDVISSPLLPKLPRQLIVGFEYSLPTDNMAVDLLFAGKNASGRNTIFLIESKQWGDDYISQSKFATHRAVGIELHPQIQVERHALSFRDYLDIGPSFDVNAFVFLRNATQVGVESLRSRNPRGVNTRIPVFASMNEIVSEVATATVNQPSSDVMSGLKDAVLQPCKSIFDAMQSVVTKEEPFVLTTEQQAAVECVRAAMSKGKKVIRIVGPAGSGKTAILLNLYIGILACSARSGRRPIFISGRQNTALYRTVYPQAANVFTYPCTLERTVVGPDAGKYIVLMDEAQHNDEGVVTQVVERGATVILCYDPYQVVSANNPIAEFARLESRTDYETIELKESVRYNGSQVAESNIKTFLSGDTAFKEDTKFKFSTFADFNAFERQVFSIVEQEPGATLAVVSQLKFAPGQLPGNRFFCQWGYQSECEWIPYVRGRNYLSKFDGRLWVGTWWLPGLDVDYVAVIVGDDLKVTSTGPVANLDKNKLFKPAVALGQKLGVPSSLIVEKTYGYQRRCDYVRSSSNIIGYLRQPGHERDLATFQKEMTTLLRNNYYIMMTRGCKGCFAYWK